jgi:hypothetical protein
MHAAKSSRTHVITAAIAIAHCVDATIPIHLLLLRTSAIFCELPLTREGCRDFRRGDGSERAVGKHDTLQTDFAFLPV